MLPQQIHGDIGELLSQKHLDQKVKNREMFMKILQNFRYLGKNICDSTVCFSIMADECNDIANIEQFTICLRWVGRDLEDHDDFIGLYQVDSIIADSLAFHIKDALLHLNVQLLQCRGQCYDGASNMSGIRSGESTQITKEEK